MDGYVRFHRLIRCGYDAIAVVQDTYKRTSTLSYMRLFVSRAALIRNLEFLSCQYCSNALESQHHHILHPISDLLLHTKCLELRFLDASASNKDLHF